MDTFELSLRSCLADRASKNELRKQRAAYLYDSLAWLDKAGVTVEVHVPYGATARPMTLRVKRHMGDAPYSAGVVYLAEDGTRHGQRMIVATSDAGENNAYAIPNRLVAIRALSDGPKGDLKEAVQHIAEDIVGRSRGVCTIAD